MKGAGRGGQAEQQRREDIARQKALQEERERRLQSERERIQKERERLEKQQQELIRQKELLEQIRKQQAGKTDSDQTADLPSTAQSTCIPRTTYQLMCHILQDRFIAGECYVQ